MTRSPKKTLPISPNLQARSYDKEDLFLAYEEAQAFSRFKQVFAVSMGVHVSGGVTLSAKQARTKGIARACADALVHRALNGKTRAAGLDAIAHVQIDFDDEVTKLHDVYNKNSGASRND